MVETPIQETCNTLRSQIQAIADFIKEFKKVIADKPVQQNEDRAEVMANLMLAYRHIEDAKMRVGKIIQAVDGVSVYDTPAK